MVRGEGECGCPDLALEQQPHLHVQQPGLSKALGLGLGLVCMCSSRACPERRGLDV